MSGKRHRTKAEATLTALVDSDDSDVTNIGRRVRYKAGSSMHLYASDGVHFDPELAIGEIVPPPIGSPRAPFGGVYVKWPKLREPAPAFLEDLELTSGV